MGKIALPVHNVEKTDSSYRQRSKRSSAWKILPAIGLTAVGALTLGQQVMPGMRGSGVIDAGDLEKMCRQPSPAATPSNWTSLYDGNDFKMQSAKRLSGAIQIPTQTFDDMAYTPIEEDPRWKPFAALREYLFKTFPTVKEKGDLELISGHSIVLTFAGSNKDLKPLMLTAHQDVVPATTSLDRWTYPPFKGIIDGEWIYGRGASDCKNTLVGLLTAVEYMLSNGFVPTRTLILAFGQDEEISGPRGAYEIGKHLEKVYGKNGIAMIVDEGGMGIQEVYGTEFAKPGLAEKGYMDFEITVDTLGGHSSVPHKHSAIGILGRIAAEIEEKDLFKPYLRTDSPIYGYLQCLAAHGDESTPSWISKAVKGGKKSKSVLNAIAEKFAEGSDGDRYLLQTSKAVTIFNGGIKINALPESAIAHVNSRVELFATENEITSAFHSIIDQIAKDFGLVVNGQSFSCKPSIGNITTSSDYMSPSPITSHQSESFDVFAAAVQAAFGPEVVTAPSAMTGNTDTRHYLRLTENVYRWAPVRQGWRENIHTVDEKLRIDAHVEAIKFFTELIVLADRSTQL